MCVREVQTKWAEVERLRSLVTEIVDRAVTNRKQGEDKASLVLAYDEITRLTNAERSN